MAEKGIICMEIKNSSILSEFVIYVFVIYVILIFFFILNNFFVFLFENDGMEKYSYLVEIKFYSYLSL